MAAAPPHPERRRRRPGSLERPVNGRLYRGTWLLVGIPLLIAAFTVARPAPLPAPALPPAFDGAAAAALATELARNYPDRSPGSGNATGAARWFSRQMAQYGFRTRSERFTAEVPGRGRVALENLVAVARGGSPQAVVVMAHRDNAGLGRGANDNASGTAALVELARAYAKPSSAPGQPCRSEFAVCPSNTIVFLSTDGGAFGALGAERFAARSPYRKDVVAVVNLDAVAGPGLPRLEFAGDDPRSPARTLLETAAARVLDQTGTRPERPSALRQLIDLGFPFSFYEQAPFVARGIPAVTLTSAGDRPPPAFGDERVDEARLAELGRSAQSLLGSLDQGLELARGTTSYLYLDSRIVRGWAIKLVLIAMLLPFLFAAIDLFARCRRRHIPLTPALRSYRSRLGFWLFVGLVFAFFALIDVWPSGAPRPPSPESEAASSWPVGGLLALAVVGGLGWLVARERLLPRRPATPEERLAGHTAALLVLGVVGLLVAGTNAFALLFVLPSLHAWLWLPQVSDRSPWARAAVLLVGFSGPFLLLWSFAGRFGLGFDAPWYVAELIALGYVPLPVPVAGLAWLAAAGQLAALTAGRYAPYPNAAERPPRGPLRQVVRRLVLGGRARRRASGRMPTALEG